MVREVVEPGFYQRSLGQPNPMPPRANKVQQLVRLDPGSEEPRASPFVSALTLAQVACASSKRSQTRRQRFTPKSLSDSCDDL
jgi:hypothetical protein